MLQRQYHTSDHSVSGKSDVIAKRAIYLMLKCASVYYLYKVVLLRDDTISICKNNLLTEVPKAYILPSIFQTTPTDYNISKETSHPIFSNLLHNGHGKNTEAICCNGSSLRRFKNRSARALGPPTEIGRPPRPIPLDRRIRGCQLPYSLQRAQ